MEFGAGAGVVIAELVGNCSARVSLAFASIDVGESRTKGEKCGEETERGASQSCGILVAVVAAGASRDQRLATLSLVASFS